MKYRNLFRKLFTYFYSKLQWWKERDSLGAALVNLDEGKIYYTDSIMFGGLFQISNYEFGGTEGNMSIHDIIIQGLNDGSKVQNDNSHIREKVFYKQKFVTDSLVGIILEEWLKLRCAAKAI